MKRLNDNLQIAAGISICIGFSAFGMMLADVINRIAQVVK